MASSRRLVELATIIHEGTIQIDEFLASEGKPSPSNNVNDPLKMQLPQELTQTQTKVVEATDELQCLLRGPLGFFTFSTASLQIVFNAFHRLDLAGAIPIGSTATYAEVASHIGINEEDTTRLLRVAMTHRIFHEASSGIVAHTALSRAIAETPLLKQFLGLATEEVLRAFSYLIDAIMKWPNSGEPNETGYNLAANLPGVAFFDGVKQDQHRAQRFEDTMKFTHGGGGYDRAAALDMHDWAPYSLVVDVGGGAGHMCIDLAKKFPHLRTVNQDLPDVIEAAPPIPEDLSNRVEMRVHDFLQPQPIKGADAYIFRWIFHDWADLYAVKILRATIPALKRGAKIIVGDLCLPEPGTIPLTIERLLRSSDMAMKATLNGKERDAGQWKHLFATANPNFEVLGIKQAPMGRSFLIEVEWKGKDYDS